MLKLLRRIKQKRKDKISRYVYEERDTMCDECSLLHKNCIDKGLVCECTTCADMRKHYIPIPGGYCPGYVKNKEE